MASWKGLRASWRGLRASQRCLRASQRGMDRWTNKQNFSPFYRSLSLFGVAAQKQIEKKDRKKKVDQFLKN